MHRDPESKQVIHSATFTGDGQRLHRRDSEMNLILEMNPAFGA